jgi:hypothetical protein
VSSVASLEWMTAADFRASGIDIDACRQLKLAQVSHNGQLLSRRGRSLPASASGLDSHRDSISSRFAQDEKAAEQEYVTAAQALVRQLLSECPGLSSNGLESALKKALCWSVLEEAGSMPSAAPPPGAAVPLAPVRH